MRVQHLQRFVVVLLVFNTFKRAKPGPAGQGEGERVQQRHLLPGLASTERVNKPLIHAALAGFCWVFDK